MADKKNLVIKVKYPVNAKATNGLQPTAQLITVWNVQRISLAAGALVALVVLLVYAFSGGDDGPPAVVEQEQVNKGLAPAPPSQGDVHDRLQVGTVTEESHKSVPEKPAITDGQVAKIQPLPLSKEPPRVRRALLATRITDKEPANQITGTLFIQPSKLVTVYYFTELRGMAGKTLYHEWLRNGVSIAKEPLQIGADRWRVSTHKTLDGQAGGNWTARLTDGNGNLLDEKQFVASIGP